MTKAKKNLLEAYRKGYRCTPLGEVISPYGRNLLLTPSGSGGYLTFAVNAFGISKNIPVHRMQGLQKFGDKIFEDGIHVRHLNGNKIDNSEINISIGTASENMLDKPKKQRVKSAIIASNHVRRFSDQEIEEIRSFHKKEKSYKRTMEKFSITSKGSLHFMINNNYQTKQV